MKPALPTRNHKRNLLLVFLLFTSIATIFGFNKAHYGPSTDLSLIKHYADKGVCPGIIVSNAKLKTKLVDSRLLYMLNLTVAKGQKKAMPRSFTIKLVDEDGFDVQSFVVESSFFTEELDSEENPTGYSYQSTQLMSADDYKSVAGWNLTWESK